MAKRDKNENLDALLLGLEPLEEAIAEENAAEDAKAEELEVAPAEEAAPAEAEPSNTGAKFGRMLKEKPAKFQKYFRGKGVRY